MSDLKIIKASAGSGKTYALTHGYLDLILPKDGKAPADAYRHILAVTFTNKATEEMKSRVIEELALLSKKDDEYGRRAKAVLTSILHDYSGFSVSTIDTFFQSVMRAFAREIGQYASYKVELDSEDVISRSVDLLMTSLERPENEDLLKWLMDYSLERIRNGGSWDVSKELKSMAKHFFSEDFKIKKRGLEKVLGDRSLIVSLKGDLDKLISDYCIDVVNVAKKGLSIMGTYNLSPSDFKGAGTSQFYRFEKWKNWKLGDKVPKNNLNKTFIDFVDNVEGWYSKSTPKDKIKSIEDAYNNGLNDAVREAVELFDPDRDSLKKYQTALLIRDNLYLLGIFSDLYSAMKAYLKENNLILLGETSDVLSRIIDGNDTPFIYEKTGTRYDHYMIDEFQDTSQLQWMNFRPLVGDSVAQGHSNLVVGDIKQSIYRWRGADSSLLGSELQKQFPSADQVSLDVNRRSCPEIVDFNNDFYLNAGKLLSGFDVKASKTVTDFYSDSRQDKNLESPGHVLVKFMASESGKNWKDRVLDELIEPTMDRLKKNFKLSDITFLVRKNDEGAKVAGKLMELGYEVVTEDSLKISSSNVIRRVMAILKHYVSPEDRINNYMAGVLMDGAPLPRLKLSGIKDSSLYGICENLISEYGKDATSFDTPFILAFLDSVLNYMGKFGSDIGGFVDWWDSVGSGKSISAPEGENAIRVMTIHKAKGLKSEAVVIPFLCEKLKPDSYHLPYIWCKPDISPFSKIGLVPLKAVEQLKSTIFAEEYDDEMLMNCVDAVNTAYVAMTRAVSEMTIFAPCPDDPSKLKSVADMLYLHLKSSLNSDMCYECGAPLPELPESDTQGKAGLRLSGFQVAGESDRLKLSLRGGDYYNRKLGIVNHDILSRIESEDDVEAAVRSAVSEGEMAASDEESVVAKMQSLLASVASRHWFDGTYRALREMSIVDGQGRTQRPDRVLVEKDKPLGEGKAIVIDYKFGEENPKEYSKQVCGYMSLLRQMGYSDISGYIWYCETNKIEQCKEDSLF